jgi:hypothetical protein
MKELAELGILAFKNKRNNIFKKDENKKYAFYC